MPLPKSKSIATIVRFLRKENPKMPIKERLAVALSHARRMGAKVKKHPRLEALRRIRKAN